MRALITERQTACFKHVARQEIAGKRKPVGDIIADGFCVSLTQKCRKAQHPVSPGFAGAARNRASGFWRYVDEVARASGCDAAFEIKSKAEFGQNLQFEAHHHRRTQPCVIEVPQDVIERIVQRSVRIALWQQSHQRSEMRDAIDGVRRREETCRAQGKAFNGVVTEMLVEPRPPCRAHGVARLQDRLEPRTEAAAHETEVAAMLARHQLEDAIRLPVTLDAQNDAVIGPLHAFNRNRQSFLD